MSAKTAKAKRTRSTQTTGKAAVAARKTARKKTSRTAASRTTRAARSAPATKKARSKAAAPKARRRSGTGGRGRVESRRKRLARFREVLLARQRELTATYILSKGDSRDNLDNGTEDYIDYAVNSYAREFLLSLTELERQQLLLIEDALRRIDRGSFGECQHCGADIHPKRLEVAPWARYCIRCQDLFERGLLDEDDEDREDDEDNDEIAAADDEDDDEEDSIEEQDLVEDPLAEPEDED